ncbi:hypothetical protein [Elizabethkingia ursingii]|uniref:hypothetical protein n=1 Tax=Elizabethkingia ursingii TaxID=1756150 RepID=UPI000A7B5CCA|nr:hypothetical protein [Elizabethkingia ursingii]
MKKNLFRVSLLGGFFLTFLFSCRTEDRFTQQQQKDMHFAVFTPKNGNGIINYPDGFAYLMKRYDKLQKTNLSGVNNRPILDLNASANKSTGIFQNNDEYVEFNVRSQTFTEENGDNIISQKLQA